MRLVWAWWLGPGAYLTRCAAQIECDVAPNTGAGVSQQTRRSRCSQQAATSKEACCQSRCLLFNYIREEQTKVTVEGVCVAVHGRSRSTIDSRAITTTRTKRGECLQTCTSAAIYVSDHPYIVKDQFLFRDIDVHGLGCFAAPTTNPNSIGSEARSRSRKRLKPGNGNLGYPPCRGSGKQKRYYIYLVYNQVCPFTDRKVSSYILYQTMFA